MRLRAIVTTLVAGAALGCGSSTTPDATSTPPGSGSNGSGGSAPAVVAGAAPGICSRWLVAPLDMTPFPPPERTASLAAAADGRGGVTLAAITKDGGGTAVAYTSTGDADGLALTLGAAPPIPDASADAGADGGANGADAGAPVDGGAPAEVAQIVATPDGWAAVFSDGYASELRLYDRMGAPTTPLPAEQDAIEIGVGTDGTIGVSNRRGAIGWLAPGATTEDVAYTSVPASSVTWAGATAYLAGASAPTMQTLTRGGASFDFPSFDVGTYPRLVPAFDGQTVIGVAPGDTSMEQPIGICFAGTAYPPRSYVLDEEILRVAGAFRAASGGAVLAWTSSGVTLWGGAPMALVELGPSGVRGEIIPLGTEVVAAAEVTIAGSVDGKIYVAVAWTSSVHLAWVLRCGE